MSQPVSSARPAAPPRRPEPEPVLRIGNHEIFWRPRYLRPSRWLEHLPFLFWLIADLRPRRCVTLGLDTGVAHFALCQGIEKLGLDALCHGFDARSEGAIPADLRAHNAEQYDDFSALVADSGTPPPVPTGSIDLVLVDRVPDAALLEALAAGWEGRLSPRALVAVAGLDAIAEAVVGRDGDAAARQAVDCLERLRQDRAHVEFTHGGGALAFRPTAPERGDEDEPARFLRLAALDPFAPEYHGAHQIFRRLGQMNADALAARGAGGAESARASEGAPGAATDAATDVAAETQAALEALRQEHETLRAAHEERHALAARLQAENFDLRQQQAQVDTTPALQVQLEAAQRRLATLDAETRRQSEALQAAEAARTDLAEQLAARNRRLATLETECTAARQALEAARTEAETRLEQLQRMAERERGSLSDTLRMREAELTRARADATEQLAARDAALAETTRKLEAANREKAELAERTDRREQESAAALRQRDAALTEMARNLEAATQEKAALAERAAADRCEIEALSRKLMAETAAREKLEATAAERARKLATLEQKLEAEGRERRHLGREIDKLMASTSWRVTAPLRRVVQAVGRNRAD